MRTLDQIRAEVAWGYVNAVESATREKYRNLAKSLPALVMSNGLLQTLAFLKGKSDDRKRNEHHALLGHILEWLSNQQHVRILNPQQRAFRDAMTALAGKDTLAYQRATEETQAILRWIRQLADTLG